jgi:hypothetical protein
MYGSSIGCPLIEIRPSRIATRSPGKATIRLSNMSRSPGLRIATTSPRLGFAQTYATWLTKFTFPSM